jgi:CBS domain-containing protein
MPALPHAERAQEAQIERARLDEQRRIGTRAAARQEAGLAHSLLLPLAKETCVMKVAEMMTREVRTCLPTDSMNYAAQIMWENNCGCVPVVDDQGRAVAMITDRDICMAAYTQGRSLAELTVASAASSGVVTIRAEDTLHRAEQLMHDAQVRRLPVVDSDRRVVGLLSLADLARRVRDLDNGLPGHIVRAFAGISERRDSPSAEANASKDPPRQGDAASLLGDVNDATVEIKNEFKKSVALLRTLRDDVRVRLHLGSMDLKEQWNKLEPHLAEVEKKAEELSDASRAAIADAVKRLHKLRASLADHA